MILFLLLYKLHCFSLILENITLIFKANNFARIHSQQIIQHCCGCTCWPPKASCSRRWSSLKAVESWGSNLWRWDWFVGLDQSCPWFYSWIKTEGPKRAARVITCHLLLAASCTPWTVPPPRCLSATSASWEPASYELKAPGTVS